MARKTDAGSRSREDGGRLVLGGVSWEQYASLLELFADRRLRITFDRGTLELMTPLSIHERYKMLIGRMIDVMTMEWGVRVVAMGSTTLRREDARRGLEPDQCYYFGNAGKVADWSRVDLDVDPPLDLAVEIDVTSDSSLRIGVYAGLKIPEIWRFDGERLQVLRLVGESYQAVDASLALPLAPLAEIPRFLQRHMLGNDTAWTLDFRSWLRENVQHPEEG
ncbi:Uma2 family endonuclease [Paludisphaera soli]|uniref:Uma2 family endonuclease n=1 Tax=Paludisphaera soli TaxID=2712865 RepID=UPI0013EB42DE|nr:Uma2 family endonuclease [Paludisphaera soli]